MRSKRSWLASFPFVLSLGISLLAAGCSFRLGESPVSGTSMGLGSSCFSGGSQVIAEYYQGHADEKRIAGLYDCASSSLKLFGDRARGETAPGVHYTSGELKTFLEERFLGKDEEISPVLMSELMALKRTLLGGGQDTLTLGEVQAARRLIEVLRDQSVKLRPYLPLTAENYSQAPEEKIAGAEHAIRGFVAEISKVLTGTGADYEFSRLDTLLREMESAVSSPSSQDAFRAVRDYLPMIQQLKALLVSRDSTRIASRDWEPLLDAMARWFGLYLRSMQVAGQNQSVISGEGRKQMLGVAFRGIDLLQRSVERRAYGIITVEEIQDLVAKMDGGMFLIGKTRIEKEHLREFIRPLFTRLLGRKDAPGITREGLERVRELLELWSEGQSYIDRTFERLGAEPGLGSPRTFRRSEILALKIRNVLGGDRGAIQARSWRSAERVRRVIARTLPLYSSAETSEPLEISMAPYPADPEYSYRALTFLHAMDLVGEIFMDAYVENPAQLKQGVEDKEFEAMYDDIRGVAGDLRIIDPRNKKSFMKRFAESNLFLPVSNGDKFMSREETALMLSYAISAKSAGARMHLLIAGICNVDESRPIPVDAFGNETIETGCYEREFFSNVKEAWKRLPGLLSFYQGLDATARKKFESDFAIAARSAQGPRYTTSDSEGYMGLSQYIESFYARFDRNHDGFIDKQEALWDTEADLSPFTVFQETLKEATCQLGSCVENRFVLESVFTYLLANGTPPMTWKEKGRMIFKRKFGSFYANRADITAVLANLSQATSSPGSQAAPAAK